MPATSRLSGLNQPHDPAMSTGSRVRARHGEPIHVLRRLEDRPGPSSCFAGHAMSALHMQRTGPLRPEQPARRLYEQPPGSLLGLQQLQVGGVDEHPAAPTAGHLAQDPGVFQPRERSIDGRHAEAEER